MDKDKIISGVEKFIDEYEDYRKNDQSNTKEICDSLSKILMELLNYDEGLSDEDLLQKLDHERCRIPRADIRRIYEFSRSEFGYYNFEHEKPFDIIYGMYYNKEKDSFDLYPFRVINVDEKADKIELLGLKLLGKGTWEEVKDMEFKFIFKDTFEYIVATGEIPDKNRLVEIRENYKEDSMGNDGYMLIALGGNGYWTKTPSGFYAWNVASNGGISFDNTSSSFGALPYVVIK